MEELLRPLSTFKSQFDFTPVIRYGDNLPESNSVVVVGMGGSAICVNLLKMLFPELKVALHNSYGLPTSYPENTHFIFNSYSGDTEEILDSLNRATKEGLMVSLLSKGGKLLQLGESHQLPYIQIPDSNLEPRFSIGYQLIGLLTLMGETSKIELLREKISYLSLEKTARDGKELSHALQGKYLVLYSSSLFSPITYLIKAAINEGAKIPAFANIIPEANHNELQGFVSDEKDEHEHFAFLFVESTFEHDRITRRMNVMEELFTKRNFIAKKIIKDSTDILAIFETILTGYYLATYLAIGKGVDPYKTPFIKEFKEKMSE